MIDWNELIAPTGFDPLMTWVVLLLGIPVLSFAISLSVRKQAPLFSTGLITINTLISLYLAFTHWDAAVISIKGEWFSIGSSVLNYSLRIDQLALAMLVVVNGISMLVHVFSVEYMRKDPRKATYFGYLGLFTFSMLGIVLFHNLLLMFVFWELVGLSSFLLIGFWFEKKSASLAANKAFIVNRIGDLGFLTGLMILFAQFGTLDLEALNALMFNSRVENGMWIAEFMRNGVEVTQSLDARWLSAAGIALFCGAVGKSAQFPLQLWLPDAMEGPTPVSALIHAATMVAAGVYLLARVFVLLDAQAMEVIAIVGAVTAFMAAIAALTQFDIKKILAYSTISQLGYMVMAMGVGAYDAGLLHLFTHAFFKAGLFLTAGIIIHQLHQLESEDRKFDVQDIRLMGGLRKAMPRTFLAFVICALALAGIPGFTGFISKDAILVGASAWATNLGGGYWLVPALAFVSVLVTAVYVFRLLLTVFFGEFRLKKVMGDSGSLLSPREGNAWLIIPSLVLALFSISLALGFAFKAEDVWLIHAFSIPTYVVPAQYAAFGLADFNPELLKEIHHWVAPVSIALAVVGFALAYFRFRPTAKWMAEFHNAAEPRNPLGKISYNHWYLDRFSKSVIVRITLLKANALAWFDRKVVDGFVNFLAKFQVVLAHMVGWLDRYIVDGFVHLTVYSSGKIGQLTRSAQTGNVQTYVLVAMALLIGLILWLSF